MPRINVTDEELRALEKLRAKNERTLGYNEGLEIAAIQVETGAAFEHEWTQASVAEALRKLKRPLPL